MFGRLAKLFNLRKDETRAEAIRLGIAVSEVQRDLPFFSRGNHSVKVELDSCVRYAMKRRPGRQPAEWAFLQRTPKEGAQYPNNWLFVSRYGDPPDTLGRVLQKIAHEWDGELLEFEASLAEISAFWSEWGGREKAATIAQYLRELAEA
jgi:hypothetical protein